MTPLAEGLCRHCGKPIVLIEYIPDPQWKHRLNSSPIERAEDLGLYCETAVAEPGVRVESEARS
jgi:hypothetical protein